jgi:polar amino acid transport system substrate-binding protein
MGPFTAAILGLGLNYAAYEAENYRAGLFSVPNGQMEAAVSLGMSRKQALRHIIIPQAIRLVIPPVTNDFISLLKDTSLVSVIAMAELTKRYLELSATYYDYIGTGIIVAIIYLLIGLPFVKLSKYIEKKYSLEKRKRSF